MGIPKDAVFADSKNSSKFLDSAKSKENFAKTAKFSKKNSKNKFFDTFNFGEVEVFERAKSCLFNDCKSKEFSQSKILCDTHRAQDPENLKNDKKFSEFRKTINSKFSKEILFADLHIHSRFSRACSKNIDFENLVKWAKVKGINLLGTGDFTHPVWFEEIEKLEDKGDGFYYYNGFPFIITGEISLIYTQEKGRRIHLVLLVPNIEIARKINSYFDTKGRRDYDGRPIFGIPADEFTREMMKISKDIEIIPAHCLVPDSLIHTKEKLKKIKDIVKGDFVLTHKGRYRKVEEIFKRKFFGEIVKVTPSCLRVGTFFTPEHPVYSIKTYKTCKSVAHTICKPTCAYIKNKNCKTKPFQNYKPVWRCVKDLKKGDVILYPRFNNVKDKSFIFLSDFVFQKYFEGEYIKPRKEKAYVKNTLIKKRIEVSKDFCRLVGYYLAEGYCSGNHIAFTFHEKEEEYLKDVQKLLIDVFGPYVNIKIKKEKSNAVSIFVYSKILKEFFEMFYADKPYKSYNKKLPDWFLDFPEEKLKELVIGWWRGDAGYSTSINLFNQFKQIFIKLGIIPSINMVSAESVNSRRKLKENLIGQRKILAKKDLFCFDNLSFFDESLDFLDLPEFKRFKTKISRRKGWIDKEYIYLPIIKIDKKKYVGHVYNLEVAEDNSYLTENLAVHNCWTPWFGVFGSMSGFDSLKECFKEEFDNIHAIETGMSSDPEMNWKIKELEGKSIVSFSDAHSFWPFRLGREATIFNKTNSYSGVIKQIRENSFAGTIETDPAYGKYHFDGHRNCDFSCSPDETKKLNGMCPKCGKSLIIGVENRVEKLSDNVSFLNEGKKPKNAKPFFKLLPLQEIVGLSIDSKMDSKKSWEIYNRLISLFGSEFEILLYLTKQEFLAKDVDEKLVDLILKNRVGKINVIPGYDGEYGKAVIEKLEEQKKLF